MSNFLNTKWCKTATPEDTEAEKADDINTNKNYSVALNVAIKNGHTDLAKNLLKYIDDEYLQAKYFLRLAIKKNNFEITKFILKKKIAFSETKDKYSLMSESIKTGNIDIISLLLKSGFAINDTKYRYFLMAEAIKNGNLDIISLLMKSGFNINDTYDGEKTVLYYAIKKSYRNEIIDLLIESGNDDIDPVYLFSFLQHNLSKEVPENLINKFIEKSDCCMVGNYGTPLVWATKHEMKFFIVENIMKKTPKNLINQTDINEYTALHYALDYIPHSNNIINKLIKQASQEVKNSELLWAIKQQDISNIKFLIDAGADFNYITQEVKNNGLLTAVEQQNTDGVKFFIDAGADVNYFVNPNEASSKSIISAALLTFAKIAENNKEAVLIDESAALEILNILLDSGIKHDYRIDRLWQRCPTDIQKMLENKWNRPMKRNVIVEIKHKNKQSNSNPCGYGVFDFYRFGRGAKGLAHNPDDEDI